MIKRLPMINTRTFLVYCFAILCFMLLVNSQYGFAKSQTQIPVIAENTDWDIQVVDNSGGTGLYTSLEFDQDGNPHISYYDEAQKNLEYAYLDNGTWVIETVDSAGDVGSYSSLALGNDGTPYISYFDETLMRLKYAYFSGSSWLTEYPGVDAESGMFTAIALDGNGFPHISYQDIEDKGIRHTYLDSMGWHEKLISNYNPHPYVSASGKYIDMVLDSNGNPHMSFWVAWSISGSTHLRYSFWDIGLDDVTTYGPPSANSSTYWTAIDMDSLGNIHIAYDTSTGIEYLYRDGSWNTDNRLIESGDSVGDYIDIAVDSVNHPHLSYYDDENQDLKYAYFDGEQRNIRVVDSTGCVGEYTSIEVDSQDKPHISYYDCTNHVLKYAHLTGELPGPEYLIFLPIAVNE